MVFVYLNCCICVCIFRICMLVQWGICWIMGRSKVQSSPPAAAARPQLSTLPPACHSFANSEKYIWHSGGNADVWMAEIHLVMIAKSIQKVACLCYRNMISTFEALPHPAMREQVIVKWNRSKVTQRGNGKVPILVITYFFLWSEIFFRNIL